MSKMNLNVKIIVRLVIGFLFIIAFLFGTAGTFSWPEAWLYIIIQFSFSTTLSIWLKKNNPELLRDRMIFMKKSAKNWDKAIKIGTKLEDKTFHKELPGYKEYAKKTKYRLLPGIW